MLTFDEPSHTYCWDGNRVPHVTGVLAPLTDYSMVPPATLELARQKGVAVHKMCEQWAKGELDYGKLPEWMFPVLDWWLQFVNDTGFVFIASERKVFHPMYRYAGTLDFRCLLPKTKLQGEGILDVKRSFMAGGAIGLQTAAYGAADDTQAPRSNRINWRAALRLREDAPPRLQIYEDRNDFNVFLAALTLHNWKRMQP